MGLEFGPWPQDLSEMMARLAAELVGTGTVPDLGALRVQLSAVASALWQDASVADRNRLVEHVINSRVWAVPTGQPRPCPFNDTPRHISQADLVGRRFAKFMDGGHGFTCAFEADGTWTESPLSGSEGGATGHWSLRDGRLNTEIEAADGIYETICVGLREARALRIHERLNDAGYMKEGVFLESPPAGSTPTEFPGPWQLWVKIGPHRQSLLAIHEDGELTERDLFRGGSRWRGLIPEAGQLHIGPWHVRIEAATPPEAGGQLHYLGTETGPASEVNDFWLTPVMPLTAGTRLRDWVTD